MSDMGQSMVAGGGGPLREVDLAKPSRPHRSGSPSEGAWITPPVSDTPMVRRPVFIVCAALLAALVVLMVIVLLI
ncbi:MAG: hypothetical protein M3Z46_09925 [Actinomycetota bacterium]|nr:hypothetical protein [Actinomycetota bacterium]